jgi:hypothetical protein
MDFLINNSEERRRIGKEAMKISDRLNIDSIMSKWDKTIEKILNAQSIINPNNSATKTRSHKKKEYEV